MSEQLNVITGTRQYVRPLTIAVEGNIGSGKSTFLAFCESDDNLDVMYEPIEKWTNVNGVNLLESFYNNPARYGMTFQMHVNLTMLHQYQTKTFRSIKLIERSLLSARHCFQRCMLMNGILEPVMGAVLDQWHESAMKLREARPHAIVYVNTSPVVAYQRLQARGRPEEASVTLDYLQQLHSFHEEWLVNEQQLNLSAASDMPILTTNGDRPLSEMNQSYDECLDDLKLLLL